MNVLPVVRPRQLIRALERAGFVVHHVRGSHYYLRHPQKSGLLITVPYHNRDLKRGTNPVAFRLRYLKAPRDIAVVKAAAERTKWEGRPSPNPSAMAPH